MSASVTAIVVTYRTGPPLKDCLYILAGDPAIDTIVVVDNGNPALMTRWLESFAERFGATLLSPGQNMGFAAGANLGAAASGTGRLLFVNPDALVKRGAAQALADALSTLREPAVAGGRIFGLDGREQRGARRRTLTRLRALGVGRWTQEREPLPAAPTKVGAVSGSFMMLSREGFNSLGGFDEEYFLHVEDVDLCRRAREAGGQVVFVPAAGALHHGATSEAPGREVAEHKAAGLLRYFRKNRRKPVEYIVDTAFLPLLSFAVKRRSR